MSGEQEATVEKGHRVYEYEDQDGNLFWSFTKYPSVVTNSRTMLLRDRVGTPFDSYLADLRAVRRLLVEERREKEAERG